MRKKTPKPNLLFVYADQMRGSALGFLGEEPVKTPQLDAFASEALCLDQAASNYPVCVPYRTCLMTGKYAVSNGVRVNCFCDGKDLPDKHQWWTDILDRHGWHCAYLGKWHITKPLSEFAGKPLSKAQGHWLPPAKRHGIRTWMLQTSNQHMAMEYVCHDQPCGALSRPPGWSAAVETERACAFIANKNGTERDAAKPFALTISFNPPHDPLPQVPLEYQKELDFDVEAHCAALGNLPGAATKMGAIYRQRLKLYYAAINGIDAQFGRLMRCLGEQGLTDNTIVIFTADHGDLIGHHNSADSKNMPWEEAMRIPFLIRWPGRIKPRRDSLLLSVADLYPSILELLGLKAQTPADLEGDSYAPLFCGEAQRRPTSQLYLHICEPAGDPAWGRRGVRTARYTLSINKAPDEPTSCVLYDNQVAPRQLSNIAPENLALAKQLIAQELEPWLRRTKDPFTIPPLETFINNPWSERTSTEVIRALRDAPHLNCCAKVP